MTVHRERAMAMGGGDRGSSTVKLARKRCGACACSYMHMCETTTTKVEGDGERDAMRANKNERDCKRVWGGLSLSVSQSVRVLAIPIAKNVQRPRACASSDERARESVSASERLGERGKGEQKWIHVKRRQGGARGTGKQGAHRGK